MGKGIIDYYNVLMTFESSMFVLMPSGREPLVAIVLLISLQYTKYVYMSLATLFATYMPLYYFKIFQI